MAIDTVAKRKSVINSGLPGLALLPPPDGSIEAIDRRRLADFYSLGSQIIGHNFWVPDRRAERIFVRDERTLTTWQKEEESDGEWHEDTEVPVD
jgi:hypothetical protein